MNGSITIEVAWTPGDSGDLNTQTIVDSSVTDPDPDNNRVTVPVPVAVPATPTPVVTPVVGTAIATTPSPTNTSRPADPATATATATASPSVTATRRALASTLTARPSLRATELPTETATATESPTVAPTLVPTLASTDVPPTMALAITPVVKGVSSPAPMFEIDVTWLAYLLAALFFAFLIVLGFGFHHDPRPARLKAILAVVEEYRRKTSR